MIGITKTEAKTLNKMGVPYGTNGIIHTVHNKHYYLSETAVNKKMLNQIRK